MNGFRRNARGRIAAGVLAAVGAAVLTAGCGSSSSTGSPQSSAASLKRAAYVSTAAPGFRLAETETVSAQGSVNVDVTANGSFSPGSRTGQISMSMHGQVGGNTRTIDMQAVVDRDTFYIKFPPSLASQIPSGKPWVSINFARVGKAVGVSGLGSMMNSDSTMYDPGQYLDYLRAAAGGSVKNLGQETLDGQQVTHYQADLNLADLANAVPTAERQAARQLVASLQKKASVPTQMPVDVWINASHLVRRIHITYNMSVNGQSAVIDMTENFSDYGPQPAPTVPSQDQTTDLTSLLPGG
jgi:hypothetical protein